VALVGFLLLLTEWGLGLFGIGDEHLYEDPFVGFVPGRDVFERVENSAGRLVYRTAAEKLSFFNHQEFAAEKASDTYRVIAVGGSTTAGRPYDDRVSFSNWLRIYLAAMDPGRTWEVINAGAISYASYRVVVLMKELVRYTPDLIVVYTGHNEFLEERSYSEIVHQNAALKSLRIWLNGLRSYTLARRLWLDFGAEQEGSSSGLEAEVTAKLDNWTGLERYHRDEELRRSVIEHFDYNLRQIVAIARAHDIDLIFVKPISNLKDFSPFKSEPTSLLGSAEIERREILLAEAVTDLGKDEPAAALELLEQAAELDPEFAETYFLIGQAHLAMGDLDASRVALVRAKELDVAPLRALEPIVDTVTGVAAEFEIPLVDLPAILGSPILGNEHLLDHVHPDLPVHSLIAEQVIRLLVEEGTVRPQPSWSPADRQHLFDQHLATLDRSYYAERDLNLAKVLGWAGKIEEAEPPLRRAVEVLSDNPEVHLNLGIVLQKQGRWTEASQELEKAVELQPDLAEAHFNLGVVYAALGSLDRASEALLRAIEIRPAYAEAYFNLGVVYRRQGNFDAAVDALHTALELEPGAAETYTQLGLVWRRMERLAEATAAFEESLRLHPDNPRALAGLGGTLAAQGDLDAALVRLQRAVEKDPSEPEAFFDLGMIYRRRDQRAEATVAYRQAIELAPDYAEARNNLGILLAEEGDVEAASRELLGAIERDPDYAEAYFNLGVLYDGVGRGDDALRAIRQAVDLAPETSRFRLALGLLLRARGQKEEALRHLQQAQLAGMEIPPEVERWMERQ
jgi:tetratricopeptide (TPR) repeat protein